MAGKNVSVQTEESKALSERIEMVRGIQRRILDPIANLAELVSGYNNARDIKHAEASVEDIVDMLRLLVMGAHVELIKQPLGSDLMGYVPSFLFEDIIRDWRDDLEEMKGGAA